MNWSDMQDNLQASVSSRGPTIRVAAEPTQPVQSAIDSAYDEYADEQQTQADAVAEELRTLSEVEKRLRKANYYRTLIDQNLFEDSASEEALEVESEFRDFALGRLRELMGIDAVKPVAAQVSQQFSAEEETALKLWANKLLGKPELMGIQSRAENKTPVLIPKAAPAMITVEPKLRKMSDNQATEATKRGRGRPPGTGKHQIANTLKPGQPPVPHQKKIIQKVVEGPNGTGIVEMDVSGQVQPVGLKPAPMPSPQQMLAMEAQNADNNLRGIDRKLSKG